MAKAAIAGHRTVVVTATDGRRVHVGDGCLVSGDDLADRRLSELSRATRILDVHRTVFLGYHDSGFGPTAEPLDPHTFSRTDVEDAAQRLADVLIEESADVLTIYDDHGVYPHTDHLQVHRVGVRAAELAGTRHVLEATFERKRFMELLSNLNIGLGRPRALGLETSSINTIVDVGEVLAQKRAAMDVHASEPMYSFFLTSVDEHRFRHWFSQEWYRQRTAPGDLDLLSLLA